MLFSAYGSKEERNLTCPAIPRHDNLPPEPSWSLCSLGHRKWYIPAKQICIVMNIPLRNRGLAKGQNQLFLYYIILYYTPLLQKSQEVVCSLLALQEPITAVSEGSVDRRTGELFSLEL